MTESEALFEECKKDIHEITNVKVLADTLDEEGNHQTAKYVRTQGLYNDTITSSYFGLSDGSGGYSDSGDGSDSGVGDGSGGDGGFGGVVGDGDGGFGDGCGDGYHIGGIGSGGVGDDSGGFKFELWNPNMTDGFYILSIRSGYYPYVIVGWITRNDFLLTVKNSRVIKRFGKDGQLAQLAQSGPIKGENPTQLLGLSEIEYVPLGSVSRVIVANSANWKECPKPEHE